MSTRGWPASGRTSGRITLWKAKPPSMTPRCGPSTVRAACCSSSTAHSHLVWNGSVDRLSDVSGNCDFAEVEPSGQREEPAGTIAVVEHLPKHDPGVRPDRAGPVGTAGGGLREGAGPPDVLAPAVDLGIIDGIDPKAVPEPTGSGLQESGQRVLDLVCLPRSRPCEGLQRLPVVGAIQGEHGRGDGVLLDVQRQAGDPLDKAFPSGGGGTGGEREEQLLPQRPEQASLPGTPLKRSNQTSLDS